MVSAVPFPSPIEYPHLKGKPHWRRTLEVYLTLDEAPDEATYGQLMKLVEQATGKRCSRKLIAKWKEERHLKSVISNQLPVISQPSATSPPQPTPALPPKVISLDNYRQLPSPAPTPTRTVPQRRAVTTKQPGWLNRLMSVGAIAVAMVGASWLLTPEDRHKPLAIAEPPIVAQVTPTPTPKTQAIEPRSLKINVTVATPEDLKVKPGDEILKGQVISDRPAERAALLAKKRQLEISIQQASLVIPPPIKPNFELQSLALQQAKLNLSPNKTEITPQTLNFIDPQLQQVFEADKLAEVNRLKQEQVKQEQAAKQQEIEIETALARLEEAKAQYQSSVTSYQQSVERQRLELTSLRTQLSEVDSQLRGLGEVRSPYSGVVKKVKVKGQKENMMEVEVTVVPTSNEL